MAGNDADSLTHARVGPPRNSTFHPQDWAVLSRSWYPVARSDAVGENPVQAQLLDVDLVVYRAAGKAIVARNLCFHRGTQLSLGWVENDAAVWKACWAVPKRELYCAMRLNMAELSWLGMLVWLDC